MNRQPSYLLRRPGGHVYFRISVPQELRPVLRKREIKQHIISQDIDEVRETAIDLANSWKLIFSRMRESMGKGKKPPQMKLILSDLLIDSKTGTTKVGKVEFDPDNVEAELEALGKHLPGISQSGDVGEESNLLSGVIKAFCAEQEVGGNWKAKTAESNRMILSELVEVLADMPIESIDKTKARSYKEVLLQLPSNYRKKAEYQGLGISEIVALKPSETLSTKSINIRIQGVSALFKWAKNNGYCSNNPFEGLSVKTKTRAADRRDPFTDDELTKIFGTSGFVKPNPQRPNRYWIPLIALYTGARLEEVAQLCVEDIRKIDNSWCLDINEQGDKKIKSDASNRVIPLHDELLSLKFIEFVETQKSNGHDRLFPELTKGRDGYGHSFQKWFGREKTKAGFPKLTKSFHSLRHTFIDRLRNLGVDEAKLAALAGHANISITSIYGQGYHVKQLYEAVNKLTFADCIFVRQ